MTAFGLAICSFVFSFSLALLGKVKEFRVSNNFQFSNILELPILKGENLKPGEMP